VKYSISNGEKFGRLTVLSYTDRPGKKGEYKCVCECGKLTYTKTWSLRSGKSRSCGCLNKEIVSKTHKLPNNLGVVKEIYRNYQQASIRREYTFKLTIDEFRNIIESECYYCKEIGSMTPYGFHKNIDYRYNGVDRINNKIGYTTGNVVSCCKICNNAKATLTISEFKNWIMKINKNLDNIKN